MDAEQYFLDEIPDDVLVKVCQESEQQHRENEQLQPLPVDTADQLNIPLSIPIGKLHI